MKRANWQQLIFIIPFVFLLSFWSLVSAFIPDLPLSQTENRALQQFPGFQTLVNFKQTTQMENYLNDQLAYKDYLVYAQNIAWLGMGKRYIRNLMITDEGHLLTAPYRIDQKEIKIAADNTKMLAADCIKQNKAFFVALLPRKTDALRDQILPLFQADTQIDVDRFKAGCGQTATTSGAFPIFDLLPTWEKNLSAEELSALFFKSDFHWNAEGAKRAFMDLLPSFSELNAFEKSSANDANLTKITLDGKPYQGDLNRRLFFLFHSDDVGSYYTMPNPEMLTCQILKDGQLQESPIDGLYASGVNGTVVDYNNVFTFNLGYYKINNPEALNKTKIFILKDSYQNAMLPFFVRYFEQVEVVDQRYLKGKTCLQYITESDADAVILLYNNGNIFGGMYQFN